AAAIHGVMREAYLVEAGLLGVTDFVPLRRSARDIEESHTRFLGVSLDGELAAVVELDEARPDTVNIDALVVRPRGFRAGLATALLRAVLDSDPPLTTTVSTAAGNTPALELYAGLGFFATGTWTTPDGIGMVTLAAGPQRGAHLRPDGEVAHGRWV
ncbi:MAG TPA: GNAT family N-acetyltransferase, partial [Coriobacteriia bacterium]